MPAPGDQHHTYSARVSAVNPFEEPVQRIDEYTAQEIATLQSRLDKRLGPEYISSRAGPGGQKVHYLAADKCISLANEVFGFNGWSSAIQNIQIDFVDENPNTGKVSLGLSVIVRVTLKNGTYHEDIGYGHIENCKGKAAAFEKAKKEGTTDALKRALRTFGNVLGNCIYDKDYLSKVTKVKAIPAKWDVAELHRHGDFIPIKKEVISIPNARNHENECGPPKISTTVPNIPGKLSEPFSTDFENEFGSDAFDETDFGEHNLSHPDEVILDEETQAEIQSRNTLPSIPPAIHKPLENGGRTTGVIPSHMVTPSKPPIQAFANGPIAGQHDATLPTLADRISRPTLAQANQYATPKAHPPPRPHHSTATDSRTVIAGRAAQAGSDLPPPLPCDQPGVGAKRSPSKTIPNSPHGSQSAQDSPAVEPGVWYSARAASIVDPGKPAPTFNPKFDSPSIRKTHTIDHNKSAPVSRKTFQNVPSQTSSQASHRPIMNNVPPANQSGTSIGARTIADVSKRPGPGTFASPARPATTTSYRPPTRRSMTAIVNNETNNATSNPPTNSATTNGKRPPLSELTNTACAPTDTETLKKPRIGDNAPAPGPSPNGQQQRHGLGTG